MLDEQGRFWHDSELVTHPGMARAFAGWIGRHPDDGRYILSNGFDWTYFTVKDAPFFVRGVRGHGSVPLLQLSDGSEEPLDPSSLWSHSSEALYCCVKEGRFLAKFTPQAQTLLAPWLAESEGGRISLEVEGRRYAIPERSVHDFHGGTR